MFCQLGQRFFLVYEGREDSKTTRGPSSAASETAFRWWADGGPTLNAGLVFQGIRTSIAKKPYIFCDFSGGPLDPLMDNEAGEVFGQFGCCYYFCGWVV